VPFNVNEDLRNNKARANRSDFHAYELEVEKTGEDETSIFLLNAGGITELADNPADDNIIILFQRVAGGSVSIEAGGALSVS